MDVKELKKELSKLSGIDFFNPKYRDVFRKYFPNDTTENDVNDNEEDRLKEVLGEENEESKTPDTQENSTEEVEENVDDKKEETPSDEQGETDKADADPIEKNVENKDVEDTSDNENIESLEQTEILAEGNQDTSTTNSEQNNTSNELLEMKVELVLIKAGVREDRLDAAKKLFMADIHSIEDLSKLKDLVQQYPEWLKQPKQEAQPFGIPLGDTGDSLTEEEKRLKAMGIDPRA